MPTVPAMPPLAESLQAPSSPLTSAQQSTSQQQPPSQQEQPAKRQKTSLLPSNKKAAKWQQWQQQAVAQQPPKEEVQEPPKKRQRTAKPKAKAAEKKVAEKPAAKPKEKPAAKPKAKPGPKPKAKPKAKAAENVVLNPKKTSLLPTNKKALKWQQQVAAEQQPQSWLPQEEEQQTPPPKAKRSAKRKRTPADDDNDVTNNIKNDDDDGKMANFERQQASFLSAMSAAASKLGAGAGTKRSLAPPSPSPSVGSTTSAAAAGSLTPRRDRDAPAANIVYSQPALTGTGDSIISQMAYAVSWLRNKDEPQPCEAVLGYLSATARPEKEQEYFVDQMRRHPQIQWIPDPALSEQTWRSGTYIHRPTIPNVRTKTQLLAYLQKKTDASGVSVKDLKDGWPDCEGGINELEQEHRVLVIRAKKDGAARMVWLDDPSLFHEVDPELKVMWSRVEVPSTENIVARLVAAQQKPASEDPMLKAMQAPKTAKKKKVQRRTNKSTNVHMQGLLKDYSHTKR
jgi:transcription initiation factor TFIIE subunit beta